MIIDIEKFKQEFFDMPNDHVQELMLALHLRHQLAAVSTFLTWDDLMSSASIPDKYQNHEFADEDKREICSSTEESVMNYIVPQIIQQFKHEMETFFLRRKTEDLHFGERAKQ